MIDTCIKDRDEQCYHECVGCAAYEADVACDECDNMITRHEHQTQNGLCKECYLQNCIDNNELISEFFSDNLDARDQYMDFLRERMGI